MYNEMDELKGRAEGKMDEVLDEIFETRDRYRLHYLLGQYDILRDLKQNIRDIQLYEGSNE